MLEGYSKIKSIEVINFMGYSRGKAVYDEEGVLNFKGYNGSGKSAFLTACAVAMMNLYPTKQAGYIKHGEEYFRVIIAFEDGVILVRDKYINGQSLYEMYKDKQLIFTTKVGNNLSKVSEVPKPIRDYLGLLPSGNGYFNYQVRRDLLWLVETKGSENYSSVHEALKTEEIARANSILNSDLNELNSQITDLEFQRNNSRMQYDSYSNISEELLVTLSQKEIDVQGLMRQYDLIYSIACLLEELDKVKVLPKLDTVDSTRISKITKVSSTVADYLKYQSMITPSVSGVDVSQYSALSSLLKKSDELVSLAESYWTEELEGVDKSKYSPLGKLQGIAKALSTAEKSLSDLNDKYDTLVEERDDLVLEAEKQGIKLVVCDNCGTLLGVKMEDG